MNLEIHNIVAKIPACGLEFVKAALALPPALAELELGVGRNVVMGLKRLAGGKTGSGITVDP